MSAPNAPSGPPRPPGPDRTTVLTDQVRSSSASKPQRVLACLRCQQRKVGCDRKSPCGNCVKTGSQCVPASLVPRQRRRRFPERELLERVRYYEGLLRERGVRFDALHPGGGGERGSSGADARSPGVEKPETLGGADERHSPETATSSDAVNLWNALNQKSHVDDEDDNSDNSSAYSHEDLKERNIKKMWSRLVPDNKDHLLFGSPQTNVDLSTLHPRHVHVFKLWQVYLDNVNPVLKVTHTPTLQTSIIDAAGNLSNVTPTLEALMFAIYCISILSLTKDECRSMFDASQEELLNQYQFGCQQALLRCGFLRSDDRDSLTALYLYLLSIKPSIDPHSLSSMLGVALRIAQYMGIHNEASNGKCSALEAEMRRRLWWALVVLDSRTCEMSSNLKSTIMIPTWDCRTPANVNDFEIRAEMKTLPPVHDQPTEALFPVVRCLLADYIRHSCWYLDFTNPSLKPLARDSQDGSKPDGSRLAAFEKMLVGRYLSKCDGQSPVQFLAMWMMRSQLEKCRLWEHFSKHSRSPGQQTDADRDVAVHYALRIIDFDTKLITSPLTKGFLWYIKAQFFFPAYIHIFQDIKKRPGRQYAEGAWRIMSEDLEARFEDLEPDDNPFFKYFSRLVLQAWDAHEAALVQQGRQIELPWIVSDVRRIIAASHAEVEGVSVPQSASAMEVNFDDFMPMPMDFGVQDLSYGAGMQGAQMGWEYGGQVRQDGQQPGMGFDLNHFDWDTMG